MSRAGAAARLAQPCRCACLRGWRLLEPCPRGWKPRHRGVAHCNRDACPVAGPREAATAVARRARNPWRLFPAGRAASTAGACGGWVKPLGLKTLGDGEESARCSAAGHSRNLSCSPAAALAGSRLTSSSAPSRTPAYQPWTSGSWTSSRTFSGSTPRMSTTGCLAASPSPQ